MESIATGLCAFALQSWKSDEPPFTDYSGISTLLEGATEPGSFRTYANHQLQVARNNKITASMN